MIHPIALNSIPSIWMDTILFPDPVEQQGFRDFYLHKYQNRKPHVIITVGPSPLRFMLEAHQTAFPGVPIVFCLPNRSLPGSPALDPDFTGVENDMAPAKTLEIALRLQPSTEHVVVGGVSDWDRQQLANVKAQLHAFTDHPDITGGYLSSLSEQGKVAGAMALRILSGAKPQDIPRVKGVNTYMFDWRALKRWGLRESDLPPESVVLFGEVSVWERTKRIWASGLLIILALSLTCSTAERNRRSRETSRCNSADT
jgi:hypothetical protein